MSHKRVKAALAGFILSSITAIPTHLTCPELGRPRLKKADKRFYNVILKNSPQQRNPVEFIFWQEPKNENSSILELTGPRPRVNGPLRQKRAWRLAKGPAIRARYSKCARYLMLLSTKPSHTTEFWPAPSRDLRPGLRWSLKIT